MTCNLATADLFTAEIARLQAEIERLREAIRLLAEQDATLSVCEGAVTVTIDATLTYAEREAVAWIPVTDRMPPDGALVFAYGKRPEYGFRRDGQWIDTLYGGVLADGPTHWMPMPPPPTDAK